MIQKLITFFLSIIFASQTGHTQEFNTFVPNGSKKIGENRFQSSRSYEDTIRAIKLKKVKKIDNEINLPHVRATFYQNTNPFADFSFINIYLNVQTGLTEIFFLKNSK